MNRNEHLMTILIEECSEVQKEVSKAMRFGLDDWSPFDDTKTTNRESISAELSDLIGTAMMLRDEGLIDDFLIESKIKNKQEKIEKYLKYSLNVGTLTINDEIKNESDNKD